MIISNMKVWISYTQMLAKSFIPLSLQIMEVKKHFIIYQTFFLIVSTTYLFELTLQIPIYSSRKWMWGVCCLMKQNCYFQRGVAECRHAATPLSSYSINTTHQGFQKRYITLLYLKGLKSYQPSKFKCLHFTPLSLVNRTFHLHFCW